MRQTSPQPVDAASEKTLSRRDDCSRSSGPGNPSPQVTRRCKSSLVDELRGYLENFKPRGLAETLIGGVSTHDSRMPMATRCSNSSASMTGISAAAAPQQLYTQDTTYWIYGVTLTGSTGARHEEPILYGHLQVPSLARSTSAEGAGIPTGSMPVDRIKSTLPTLIPRTAPSLGDIRSRVSESEFSRKK